MFYLEVIRPFRLIHRRRTGRQVHAGRDAIGHRQPRTIDDGVADDGKTVVPLTHYLGHCREILPTHHELTRANHGSQEN